jgi:hypothetical protein
MNRRKFFSFLGIGTITAIAAPKVFASELNNDIPESQTLGEPCSYTYTYRGTITIPCTSEDIVYYTADNTKCGQVATYVWRNAAV